MEYNEMINKLGELKTTYKKTKYELRMQYAQEHAKFKIGDFIGNVTGTIKVEKIGFEWSKRFSSFDIVYSGKRYRRIKGIFILCKDQRYCPRFREKDSQIRK
jgi:hypothetical protein